MNRNTITYLILTILAPISTLAATDPVKDLLLYAKAGRIGSVKSVLLSGTGVNAKNEEGKTALMGAVEYKNMDSVKYLLSVGADVNAQDKKGVSPFMLATRMENPALFELLLEQADVNMQAENGESAFLIAARNNDQVKMDTLILHGVHVRQQDKKGFSAIHHLTIPGNQQAISLILSRGGDLNVENESGITPLMLASYHGHV
ncbi:MAG: ankyrin repeat domain-containing protein, partial [Gammaproteobacteria bacterium]|nr:ankyrin repeat domain-containing protein [Gammaproteobacteria bacterium]